MKNTNFSISGQGLPEAKISKSDFHKSLQTKDKIDNQKSLNNTINHSKVLQQILESIEAVDFREKAELNNEKSKLHKKHYAVITIEEIISVAQKNNWSMCQRFNNIYIFNGAYWSIISNDDLKTFLGKAAERMTIDKFDARHYSFKSHLFNQFLSSQHLPLLERENNTSVLINLQNGTFEIDRKGGILRDYRKEDFLTYQLPFEYNKNAKAPLFQKYLNRVQPEQEAQDLLAEYVAYIFAKHLKLEKALILYGSGANGKSVFFEVICALLGIDNVTNYSLQSLTEERGYYRAKIANVLLNYSSEINGKLESSIFKQMVSGEPLEARLPMKEPIIIRDYARLIFNCNELPHNVEHTHAFFRRFIILPFNVTIPKSEQDRELPKKIINSELSGVFNWVLEGLNRLLKQGQFTDCQAATAQLEEFKVQSDSVQLFLVERFYKASSSSYILLKEIYHDYKVFCIDDGYKFVGKKEFRRRLAFKQINITRKSQGNVVHIEKSTS